MSLLLVDGSALIYRMHYAFAKRPLTSPSGENTSVCYGFLNTLLKLLEEQHPDHLAVVLDVKGKNFRHEMYPEYKANRKPMPPELAEQLPRLHELLSAWGVCVLKKKGYEADDLMAALARQSTEVTDQVWLFSGDKDFMQLLDDRIGMLKPGRRGDRVQPWTAGDVKKVYGLEPPDLVQVFALAGDKSDNIPGAPGIGDKTALKLIKEFGSLDKLFAGLERSDLTPRLKRILKDNRDQVYLSRDLFILKGDMELAADWSAMEPRLPIGDEVGRLLQELGLRRIREQIHRLERQGLYHQSAGQQDPPAPAGLAQVESTAEESLEVREQETTWAQRRHERGYRLLAEDQDIQSWLELLDETRPLAVDTETDGLRRDTARLVGLCLAGYDSSGQKLPGAYVPVLWREDQEPSAGGQDTLFPTGPEKSRLESVRSLLGPVLARTTSLKIGQNLKFDEWILDRHGLSLAGPRFDTMLASYVLDPGRRSHGLDDLVLDFLQHRMMPYAELFERGDRTKDILSVNADRLALYGAEDADFTLRLFELLEPNLEETGLADLFHSLEMPVSAVLLAMEKHGIMLDREFLGELRERFARELDDLTARILAVSGQEFNINSPQQLAEILFQKIGLKPIKKTATGFSTDSSVLSALAADHELPGLILDYRQVAKLQNTYVETLPKLVHPETGLIHTSYNQAVAATGRLSSSDPNLQNIPIRTELGRQIRRAFVPRHTDHVFLSADYSQVELRLLAHLAEDPGLQAAFTEQVDVHRRTAALIDGVPESQVTPDMRSRAKTINFGVIYGMGARALARQLGVKVKEAQSFIETYFETYPGVRLYIEKMKETARRQGWVETLLGRRRFLPAIQSENHRIRSFQERVAVNTPIQGTAADLIKRAMLRIHADLEAGDTGAMLLLQVHDELVLEVSRSTLDQVEVLVRSGMENALELKVPLVVDIHTGENWAEAHG